ncbi:hypothetical protein [Akkermansia muciniphila]|uniref:hypothetical protein n=1 Tax=Akkermansia muciniphila TaxID=239935 RepID=UPI00122EAD47
MDIQIPKMARLKLGVNKVYPIVRICWEAQQVTLEELPNLWNTVSFKNVDFIVQEDEQNGYDTMGLIQVPKKAMLKLGVNKVFPIVRICWKTQMVTLEEKPNSWNTVDFRSVEFIMD